MHHACSRRVTLGGSNEAISPHPRTRHRRRHNRCAYAQPVPFEGERHVRVMTRNVYHGVNTQIFDVPNATSVADLLSKVAAVIPGTLRATFRSARWP